jgi:predicted permease
MEFFVSSAARARAHESHGALGDADARSAARRRFGNSTYYREEARRVSGLTMLDTFAQDVRFALRTFARTPTFTAIAVSTLAIGIGANTAIFSAVDTLLLQPLPFKEPDRLMNVALSVASSPRGPGREDLVWSYPKVEAFRTAQSVFSNVTAWFSMQFTVRVDDEAERISGEFIDSRYFPTLGITPVVGRTMLGSEDRIGGPRVVVISDVLWRGMFNANPSVLGEPLDVDGTIFTIIGVAPPEFNGVSGIARFWIPFFNPPAAWGVANLLTDNNAYYLIGRLAPGITPERAALISREIGSRIDAQFPEHGANARHWGIVAHVLNDTRVDDGVRRTLAMLFAAVGMVLLVACANVASLFLVRAASRRREIAVRLAIGASRGRLIRQLMVESVLLSLFGGAASLIVAWVGVHIISAVQPVLWGGQSPSGIGTVTADPIRLNFTALAFTGTIAIATGLLFGVIPAIQSTRPTLTDSLKVESGSSTRSRITRHASMRDVLTVLEIALAVVLLATSGVLVRTLANLIAVRPGFEPSGVLTMRVNRAPAWSRDSISRFYDVALDRLRSLPGVTQVAIADCAPQSGGCTGMGVHSPDRPERVPVPVGIHWITSDWNAVMRVPLVRGRLIQPSDRKGTPFVVLVSETAAKTLWPGEDPLGKTVVSEGGGDTARVVGVVGDVRFRGIQSRPMAEIYMSYYQQPLSYRMMLHLRTTQDPAFVAEAARRALREVARGFPVYDVATLEERIGGSLGQARFMAQLLSLFAILALVLATIGTYGVISYGVAQRTREMGVRIALGARARDVIRLVVGQGVRLAVVGGIIGMAGAIVATRSIQIRLYDVPPADPWTLGSIVVLLALAVLAASWIPARRAASIPAVQALRGG